MNDHSNDGLLDQDDSSQSLSLKQVLPRAKFFGGEDLSVCRLVADPQQISPGDVLAILPGCDDPLAIACQAMAHGASGLLLEQLLPVPLPQCIVADVPLATATVCAHLDGNPSSAMLMIGVIGNAGKSTTALLTAAITRAAGFRTAYETDLGCSDGVIQSVPTNRHLDPVGLSQFLADARDSGSQVAIVELSETLVRSSAFRKLRFDIVVQVGEIAPPQLCQPNSLDLALQQLREDGAVVINGDCREALAACDRSATPFLTYGMRSDCNVSAKIFDQQPGETTLMVSAGDLTIALETPLTGPNLAASQLAATTIGLLLELPLHKVVDALTRLRVVPGRMQRLAHWDQASYVLDACCSSQRLANTLRSLRRERCGGKIWVIAPLCESQTPSELAAMARVAERYADHVVVTNDSAGSDQFLERAHCWWDGVDHTAGVRVIAASDTAVRWVSENASSRDTVLIVTPPMTNGPAAERAWIDQMVELCNEAQPTVKEQSAMAPVILSHPALGKQTP